MRQAIVGLAIVVLAGACGAAPEDFNADAVGAASTAASTELTSTTAPSLLVEQVPLVVIAETGGCYMLGPNCSTTLVMSDGTFGVFRNDPADVIAVPTTLDDAEYTGSVDIQAFSQAVAASDFDELRSVLGPGECRGCVDGIDYQVRFFTEAGPEDLASVDYEFDSGLELFTELNGVMQAAAGAGTLEMLPRGS